MRYFHLLFVLAVFLSTNVARAVEPSDLKPGLVATYSDGSKARSVTRLEPTVAITLAKHETPHPLLESGRMMNWKGHINIARAGKYRFDATIRGGTLTVKVDGLTKLAGSELDIRAAEVQFDGGILPFEVTFAGRAGEAARVELFWQGPGFIKEPLPNQFLGHLPKDRPPTFTKDSAIEHGRFKFEELACIKCHKPNADDKAVKTLAERTGPILTEIAKRAYPGWIYAWLEDPAKHRPHTTMPKTFADDAIGAAERYAVTQYLVSLAGKPLSVYKPPAILPNDLRQSIERGRVLFSVTGCAACHSDPLPKKRKDDDEEKESLKPVDFVYGLGTLSGPAPKYNLGALGSKTRLEALAAYLQNPAKTNPHGRMPIMNLSATEATDIARFLCRVQDETVTPDKLPMPSVTPSKLAERVFPGATEAELQLFTERKTETQWSELGAQLVVVRGCVNCHAIETGGKTLQRDAHSTPSLQQIQDAGAEACLSAKPNPLKYPEYKLEPQERAALAAFVKDGLGGAGSPAPAYQARVALRRFNCLNCHQRDGEGGIPAELADQMRALEKAENADDVRPPVLTGVGHKSRTTWLKTVLTQSGRARPWMQLRMPQYGDAHVGFLPEAIAALEGTVPDDKVHEVKRTAAMIVAGRNIIGKGGLGCISCHDIGGIANTGTRGPELATINQRVRYEWYERWLSQPLRMAPGTRMPQAFVEGKSTLTTALNGSPHLQAEAMWAYLALGVGLPLPDGLEPPKGLVVVVKDRPEMLRTFLPDAGTKAIGVGYPGSISIAFSADECRTAYSWAGNFLDASPVWNNRGGSPAKLLGQKFWSAPPGHPWGLTLAGTTPPDFLARAKNPAFGFQLPLEPARIYDGPMAVKFDGYSLDKDGKPTFRYRLDEKFKGKELMVEETPFPLKRSFAIGLGRKFEIAIPGEYQAWLLAGQTSKAPRAFDAAGKLIKLDLKAEVVTAPASARVVLPGDNDRATVLEAAGTREGDQWYFVPVKSGGWLAVFNLYGAKKDHKSTFTLNHWGLPKDDDTLLKDLFAPLGD